MLNIISPSLRQENISDLEIKQEFILSEIRKLGLAKEELDSIVEKHSAKKISSTKLDEEIKDKTKVSYDLKDKIKSLNEEKSILISDITQFKTQLIEKKDLELAVAKLKSLLKTLREEETNSKTRTKELQEKSGILLKDSKEKLIFIQSAINALVSKL